MEECESRFGERNALRARTGVLISVKVRVRAKWEVAKHHPKQLPPYGAKFTWLKFYCPATP